MNTACPPVHRRAISALCVVVVLTRVLAGSQVQAWGHPVFSALKLDVLCRGGHGSEKLDRYRVWCDGYATGVRELLLSIDSVDAGCVPASNQALWDRFGAWLVANPDRRHMKATDAVWLAIGGRC